MNAKLVFLLFLFISTSHLMAQSNHSIVIGDATNDFTSSEVLGIESGFTTYLTWDATYLYIGIEGGNAMVGTFTNLWVVIDTDPPTHNDSRSGNGLNIQPVNHAGGADYPINADYIFEFYGAAADDGSVQSPALGRAWTVSSGAWADAAHNNNTQIRRHSSEITDLKIPFSDFGLASGDDFNIIIYLANTGTSGSDTNYAQWPANNPNRNSPTDTNSEPMTHYFTFTRTTGISQSDDKYLSIRTYASSFTFGETELANLALIGGGQTYTAGSLTNIHKSLVILYGATFTMGTTSSSLIIGENVVNDASSLTLSSSSGGDLYVGGDWVFKNVTTFTTNTRQVTFNGTANQMLVHNNGVTFDYLEINKTGGDFQTANDVTCTNRLLFGSNNIGNITTTNANTIYISNTAADDANNGIVRNGSGMITTQLDREIGTNTGRRLFPVGNGTDYRALTLDPIVAPTTSGKVSLDYTQSATINSVSINDNGTTISLQNQSSWAISTSTLTGGTYDLELRGDGMQVNDVSHIRICQASSAAGTQISGSGSTTNPQANRTGLSLSDLSNTFYIGSTNALTTLPVEWLFFKGKNIENGILLEWATASESDNEYFEIEYGTDGVYFENIGKIASKGNSLSVQTYDFFHKNNFTGIHYYRLKQVDKDRNYQYSAIIEQTVQEFNHIIIDIYPNPTSEILNISTNFNVDFKNTIIQIHSSDGKLILARPFQHQLQIDHFPKGLYFLTVISTPQLPIFQTRFIKF